MTTLRVTFVAEGTSDRALLPVIHWALREAEVTDFETNPTDWSRIPLRSATMADKIRIATELFPCDLLIVHRDADGEGAQARREEIVGAVGSIPNIGPHVPIVPIRMTEAWLLFNEPAIRSAAGNPYSSCRLELPTLQKAERLADPKSILFEQLRLASQLTGRRLHKFDRNRARAQISEYIDDFSPLRELVAFRAFEANLRAVLRISVGRK